MRLIELDATHGDGTVRAVIIMTTDEARKIAAPLLFEEVAIISATGAPSEDTP
jgi:hypothetical protein